MVKKGGKEFLPQNQVSNPHIFVDAILSLKYLKST